MKQNLLKLRKEKQSAYVKSWRLRNPEKAAYIQKKTQLRNRYGISMEQFEAMQRTQDGRCAICQEPPLSRGLAVDHCHATKKIRGLLCYRCNIAIGYLQHDPVRIARAATYLS